MSLLANEEEGDIYRGSDGITPEVEFALPPPPPPLSTISDYGSNDSSSSSSSTSTGRGMRRGIANLVERAISKWAHTSETSSSSSDTTSLSSLNTAQPRRKRPRTFRRNSSTTVASVSVVDRAKVREAVENSRRVQREFTLFVPGGIAEREFRTLKTANLQLILIRLQAAIRKSAKGGKEKERPRHPFHLEVPESSGFHQSHVSSHLKPPHIHISHPHRGTAGYKGKHVKPALRPSMGNAPRLASRPSSPAKSGWWLDVANPTWDDMRKLGQVRF